MSRPVSDLVADICRDLGLNPHWARLAKEAWAEAEIQSEAVGEALQAMLEKARPLPLAGEGDREAVERAHRCDTG